MKNCGFRLTEKLIASFTFSQLCRSFYKLWGDTIALAEDLFHGDALPHNVVYNEVSNDLVLIDLDESTVKTNAPMRSDSIEGSKEDFVYLRYPNYFRAWRHRVLYTQTQLVASFLLLVSYLNDESLQENQKDPVKDLIFWHKRPMNTSRHEIMQSRDVKTQDQVKSPKLFQPWT